MKPAAPATPSHASHRTALAVLVLGLAMTAFGVWREHTIIRQNQLIRWNDALAQIQPEMSSLVWQRFATLQDQAKTILRHDGFSPSAWESFLAASEWQERLPGVKEIGYAEYAGGQCVVKYAAGRDGPPAHGPGFDLASDQVIADAVAKSADAGFGHGSREIVIGTNHVVIGLMNIAIHDRRPSAIPAENRANLRGFLFVAIDQRQYVEAIHVKLASLPVELRLLGPEEAAPLRTATRRVTSSLGALGEWRFVLTIKDPPAGAAASQWLVLVTGLCLSGLLYFLFSVQASLRFAAELASREILRRELEITALNRQLERKVAERTARLDVALAEEKELNRLKSNFISIVTHEIRTPLALILGSSEILGRYLDRLPAPKRAEHLKTIGTSVQRMSGLLEDVLLFSKAEAGRMEFNPVEMDLRKFCVQLVDELMSATNRRCPIVLAGGAAEPARADEKLLRHIFSNLLTNAVKYSPAGIPVTFSVTRDGGSVDFIVQDRGMGIPGEDCERLFTPFFRGKNVATLQGTGLGLVIVKHCVERHGGKMTLESVEGLGTTVTVRLPLYSPAHTEFIRRIAEDVGV